MKSTFMKSAAIGASVLIMLAAASPAFAQSSYSAWSFEAAIGFDNGIAGHINSSGIGTINNQMVVIKSNTYEEVYGTGLNLRLGGAYAMDETTEITGIFTFQSLDADQVVPIGDIGVSNLYGRYSDYQSLALDFGLRRYLEVRSNLKVYGEGTIGLGFVDKIDVQLVAPSANLARDANDFYDQTAAFSAGANFGIMFLTEGRMGYFAQLGLRYLSGLAEIDDLVGTGLDDINDKSSRWTMPFVGGVRIRF